MKAKSLISLLFFFMYLPGIIIQAQNAKIDSLKKKILNAREDSNLVKTYFRLGIALTAEKNFNAALENFNTANIIAKKVNHPGMILTTLFQKTLVYLNGLTLPDSALKYLSQLKKEAVKFKNYRMEFYAHLIAANAYCAKGSFAEAATASLDALKIAERNHFQEGIAMAHKGIGVAHAYLTDYKTAVNEYNTARDIYFALNDTLKADELLFVLGIAYGQLRDSDKAIDCLLRSLKQSEREKNEEDIHLLNNELAGHYATKGDFNKALSFAGAAYEFFKKNNNKEATANSCAKMIMYLGQVKRYKEKLPYINEMYSLSIETNNTAQQYAAVSALSNYYEDIGDYKTACALHKRELALHDSIFSNKFTAQVAEMSKKYETEKKDKELLAKESEIKIQQADANTKSTQRNFFIGGFGVMALMAVGVFRGYTQKKKANVLITGQKHIIEEKQKEILDSIHYAQRIQKTLLASTDFLNEHIPESFVLFKPKDIVSGDFYWACSVSSRQSAVNTATEYRQLFYLAVCDSTGHGVPGAFMSLLSIGFMSEAIKEKEILDPAHVFNYVRKRLIESISKDGQQDGFDGILLCIDKKTNDITYAAANNSPVIVSKGQVYNLKCDKMPVGKGEKEESFNVYSAGLNKGDTLYCYTDGYADQFGGPKAKNLSTNNLTNF